MKKLLAILILFPLISQASLWTYYDGNLPSVDARAPKYYSIFGDTEEYRGTYDQNIKFEKYLRGNQLLGGAILRPLSDTYVAKSISFPASIEVNDTQIDIGYTDDTSNENVIIKTDQKTYGGWDFFDVVSSVENKSGITDIGSFYGYFNGSEIESIEKLFKEVPYDVEVNDYGKKEITCDNWVETKAEIPTKIVYQCEKETYHCDVFDGKTCLQENALLGNHKETRYKDEWQPLPLVTATKYDIKDIVPDNFKVSQGITDTLAIDSVNYYKIRVKVTPKTQGEFMLEWKGAKTFGINDPWYNASYQYCQKVTLLAGNIATTTTNGYAITATSTQAILKDTTNGGHVGKSDGSDILFTSGTDCNSDSGSLLNFERELYASTTGQTVFHIKSMDISSTTNKTVLMYYGNASATDQATTTGVWNGDFAGVWHLPDNITASSSDSTKNAYNGIAYGGASTTPSGLIDGSMQFDGTNDAIQTGNINLSGTNKIYVSFWLKWNAYANDDDLALEFSPNFNETPGSFFVDPNSAGGAFQFYTVGNIGYNGGTISRPSAGVWHNYVLHIDTTDTGENEIKVYVDGSIASLSKTHNSDNTGTFANTQLNFMSRNNTSLFGAGTVDEVRIKTVDVAPMDILTDYNCQMKGCVGYGAEETATPAGGGDATLFLIME